MNCGNWTMPCRSVRHAVKISDDGDQIHIDHAEGRPYMECENMTKSSCPIELRKSVSFYGINGKAEVRCKKDCNLFRISRSYSPVQFVNLIISSSSVAVQVVLVTAELVFDNTLVKNNSIGINGKLANDCSIKIVNSSFEYNYQSAIRLLCSNLTVHISSSAFKLSPVPLRNLNYKNYQTKVFVHNTVFDGENTQICADMFLINPSAAVVDITMVNVELKNYQGISCSGRFRADFSALSIRDSPHKTAHRFMTKILLKGLLVENNHDRNPTIHLVAGFVQKSLVACTIRDSVFRNNSVALWVSIYKASIFYQGTLLINNTFIDNFSSFSTFKNAAAIYFDDVDSNVNSCRFLDNRIGESPTKGVVTISKSASVTFSNCYFENKQTSAHANQVFATGDNPVVFRSNNTFNLLALNGGQSVLMHRTTGNDFSLGLVLAKQFKFLCPQGYRLTLKEESYRGTYYYLNIRCEQCPTTTYSLTRGELIFNKSNGVQCQQCPRGGNCDGGLIIAKPNFWGYKTNVEVSFVPCPPKYCCVSEDCATYHSCYGNRSGTLCGECPEGMSESLFSTQCISNAECSINYFIILGTTTLLALYLVFFLYQKEIVNFLQKSLSLSRVGENVERNTGSNTYSANGLVKIFFYYYQVCNLLKSSVGSREKSKIIQDFEHIISGVMNMIFVNVPSLNCPFKDLRAVPKAVVLHSVGFCLLGLLSVLHLVGLSVLFLRRKKGGSERRAANLQYITRFDRPRSATTSSFSQRVASAFTYISLLMYASSAQLCLSLLHCVPIGDSQVLFLDGNIKCYKTFQYFLLGYMISSILPFCLVPVLGPYLLKVGRIGVKQFCAACIFPLPFCCFWMHLFFKDYCRRVNQEAYNIVEQNRYALNHEQSNEYEQITSATHNSQTTLNRGTKTAILTILVGPFRPHQAFMCFPSSRIPWEGFLIFRRLVLIVVLNFVHDIQVRLFIALTLCVAILIFHMLVYPFQRKSDNVLESCSLGAHVVLCGLTLIQAFHYGVDYSSFSNTLSVLNMIESLLIVAPLSIIIAAVILCLVVKLVSRLIHCVSVLIQKLKDLVA
jgi:hypothetical protein